MLPLRDLLRELELEVVAGEAGLDRAVRWVHSSELADPTPWLSGGELLLTTGLALGDEAQQRAYVERLATHGLSGLGFGVGFSHERAPDALRAAAAEHGFPLFEVPYELPFIAITEKAFTHLVNEQYAVLRRALSAHERLERIVLSERGLDGVAGELAALIGGPALIFDGRGELLARRGTLADEAVAALSAELRERALAGGRRGFVPGADGVPTGALALPVARGARARPRRRAAARGVADRGQGRRPAERARPPDAAPGGDDRRARAAAPAGRRRHRAAAGRRRDERARGGRPGRARARAPAGAVRPARARRRARASRRRAPAACRPRRRSRGPCARRPAAGSSPTAGRFLCALLPGGAATTSSSRSPSGCTRGSRGWRARRCRPAPGGRSRPATCGAASTRRAARSRRGRWRSTARDGLGDARHLPRPRLLPAAALAPGRRRAAAVLRLDPGPDRGVRGRLRRRADALARGLHRVQRTMGARSEGALLPPSHPALPDPPRGGAHRTVTGFARDRIDFWLALRGRELVHIERN